MTSITEALWLFLPAAVANATPVVANFVPGLRKWETPIDLHKSYHGKRWLGDNKRWRGVVCGVLLAGLTGYVQNMIYPGNIGTFPQVLFAMCIGFGALYGDAVESFLKRQQGFDPGKSWFPYDQLDYIVGGLIAALPFGFITIEGAAVIVAAYFGLHLVTVFIAHRLGIRSAPI